jgi:hypothetical protein
MNNTKTQTFVHVHVGIISPSKFASFNWGERREVIVHFVDIYVIICDCIVMSNTYCVMFFVWFVFVLCLVCPMLPISLDCPFLIAPLVFFNVYLIICMLSHPYYDKKAGQQFHKKYNSEWHLAAYFLWWFMLSNY